nr:heat shock transcription factor, Y-linked-like [Symphalangus syndactylus]
MDNHNSGLAAETTEESSFPTSTNLNMPLTRKYCVSQRIASSTDPIGSSFPPPSSTSVGSSDQIATDQHAILNQLTNIHMYSHSTYMQTNGHIVNFVTTTASQYHIIPPLQNSFLGLTVEQSTFPTRHFEVSVNEAPYPNLPPSGNQWFQMPMTFDTLAACLSRPSHQPSSLDKHHPNYY